MSVTINFSKNTSAPWQSNANMLKSTREKIQRQEERDGKIAFFETQKQNLKNQKADTIEEIAKKLEKFHTYEDEIAAAKQEYNSSQMFHILDEAEERGEQMATSSRSGITRSAPLRVVIMDAAAFAKVSISFRSFSVRSVSPCSKI